MPQFDTFIFTHIIIYLFIFFVFSLYNNTNYILPKLSALLKLRNKLTYEYFLKKPGRLPFYYKDKYVRVYNKTYSAGRSARTFLFYRNPRVWRTKDARGLSNDIREEITPLISSFKIITDLKKNKFSSINKDIDMLNLLLLSFIMFAFSLGILVLKPNILFVLFSFEILLLTINFNFIFGGILLDDLFGSLAALLLFAIAAIDTGIGLLLLLNYYNLRYTIKVISLKKA